MKIEYTYEILSVDAENKNMMMNFSAEGCETVLVGARLPYEGETVADVAAMYAPVHKWEHDSRAVVVPEVGHKGVSSNSVSYPQEIPADEQAKMIRNSHLLMSDWTQTVDAPLTAEQKAAWATYRQALRDVPAQAGFPDNIVWPEQP